MSEPRRQAPAATPCSAARPTRRWTLAMPRRVVRTGTRLLRPWPKLSNFRLAATFTGVAVAASVHAKQEGADHERRNEVGRRGPPEERSDTDSRAIGPRDHPEPHTRAARGPR